MKVKPMMDNAVKTSVDFLNEIGSTVTKHAGNAKSFVKEKIPKDKFEKTSKTMKDFNVNKDTTIGAGVAVAVAALALKSIAGITKTIKGIKKETK